MFRLNISTTGKSNKLAFDDRLIPPSRCCPSITSPIIVSSGKNIFLESVSILFEKKKSEFAYFPILKILREESAAEEFAYESRKVIKI